MIKPVMRLKMNEKDVRGKLLDKPLQTQIVFREIQKDTIGRSTTNPTWGYIYYNENQRLKFKGIGLYKEYDYDQPKAAYAEKLWSIMGTELLENQARVPKIDMVEEKRGYPEIISHRLMDNDKEDMTHIKDIMFNKYEREEAKTKREIYGIEEILECVKLQIEDEKNYKEVEEAIIQTLLLDSITNNGDRHVYNWALVRNKSTNRYELAVFDHSNSFVDMFEERGFLLSKGWGPSYVTIKENRGGIYTGNIGKDIVEHISKEYPEYFEEFSRKFEEKLPSILDKVKSENIKIDFARFSRKLQEKNSFLRKLKSKGEIEYE